MQKNMRQNNEQQKRQLVKYELKHRGSKSYKIIFIHLNNIGLDMLPSHCQLRHCSCLKFNKPCDGYLFLFSFEYVRASLPHFACSHLNPVNEDVLRISWFYLDSFAVFIAKSSISQYADEPLHVRQSESLFFSFSYSFFLSFLFHLSLVSTKIYFEFNESMFVMYLFPKNVGFLRVSSLFAMW